MPTDGDALFSITIIASDEFLLPATEGSSQYYTTVEVTIEEDDGKTLHYSYIYMATRMHHSVL